MEYSKVGKRREPIKATPYLESISFGLSNIKKTKLYWNKNADIDIKNRVCEGGDRFVARVNHRAHYGVYAGLDRERWDRRLRLQSDEEVFSEYWTFIRSVGAESKATSLNSVPA